MEFFALIIVGGLIGFVSLVIWSAVRVSTLGKAADKVEALERELDRMQGRLAHLERRTASVPVAAAQGEHWQTAPPPAAVPIQAAPKPAAPAAPLQAAPPPAATVAPPPVAAANATAHAQYASSNAVHIPPRRPGSADSPLGRPPVMPPAGVPVLPAAQVQQAVPAPVSAIDLVMQNAARIQELSAAQTPPAPPPIKAQQPSAQRSPERPTPAMAAANPVEHHVSLEERLGRNWLNKLGIVALVTGLALLLGYQLRSLGPIGKSVMGFILSIAILVTGLLLERRNRYRIFARAAIGGGWALLFFVTFALYHLPAMQVLHSEGTDLVLMMTVATAMVVHSLRYRSQTVTSLAFLLGFLTVAISHVTLFSLVAGAILAAGLVVVAFRERWFVLALGGLASVYLTHGLWLYRLLPDGASPGHPFDQFVPSAALLLFYWLIFRLFYIFRIPENDTDRVCSTLNVLLNSTGLLILLKFQSSHPEWAFRGLLALGAAEMILALVARRRHHQAFTVLACIASVFLLAAIPFHFAGTSWALLWLLESELFFVAGLASRETIFRRLGIFSGLAAVAQLIGDVAVPIFTLRQSGPDASHHVVEALAFGCAALAAWFNAEYATRRWPHLLEDDLDRLMLRVSSYAAVLCAGLAVWFVVPGAWTLLPWLAVGLLLAFASGRLRSADLAQQADLLNLAVIARIAMVNFTQWDQFADAPRTVILLIASALLYVNMRRRQAAHALPQKLIEPAYAWAAFGLLSVLSWYALQPAALAVAWCLMGTVLLETGLAARKTFFRHQGFILLAASFVRLFFINIALDPAPRMYTMLSLAALYAWVYQRLHTSEPREGFDRLAGAISAWFATATVATLLYFSLRPELVATGAAGLAVAILLLARVLRRPLFTAQAMVLVLLAAGRTLAINVLSPSPLSRGLTEGRIFTAGIPCALLLLALPIAFSLRKLGREGTREGGEALHPLLRHPEQILFFAPLLVMFVWVPVQFSAGMMTVGWSVLGLLTFLFALCVGERSFRLTGLGVLLVGVAKIITVDIWQAAPIDRYITLIVVGAALLFVSFLYSRYRETILELL